MDMQTIGMACDHAGYKMKESLKRWLARQGYKIVDFGTHSEESMDYPDTAHPLAVALERGQVDFGIALCGSGNGISMTLNKHQGVRAALCWKSELGALAKQHNNANVLALGGRTTPEDLAIEIVDTWLDSEFEGGRHARRTGMLDEM